MATTTNTKSAPLVSYNGDTIGIKLPPPKSLQPSYKIRDINNYWLILRECRFHKTLFFRATLHH